MVRFWVIDFLKGRPIRKCYNEVKYCYVHGTSTEDIKNKICKLIKHAVSTTQFYNSYNTDIVLSQLPVVNKGVYINKYDKLLSLQFLNEKSNRQMSTSGSTGVPFTMIQNPSALRESSLQSMTSQSESLSETVRHELEEKFFYVVRSIYSNNENGIMGIQDKDGVEYYMDTSSYYFEFLSLEKDVPVNEGELGWIVVTDLYNYAFPILRYDTGDLGKYKLVKHHGRHKLIITELFSRQTDTIFDCKGIEISPFAISSRITHLDCIKHWQLVQVGERKYQLIINLQSNRFDEKVALRHLREALGNSSEIEVLYTDEIPVLASGKRRRIVNRYLENKALGE